MVGQVDDAVGEGRGPLPVVDFLKIPETGDPYLEGHKCKSCGAVFLGERGTCSKCGDRGGPRKADVQ